ncbi:putative site-specific integrase-resolvase [Lactobacillus colini]|uniref:Site-specific integrase-resolvase n=1 Tax=Lactobacillus colini TaxID=1819254 RepID=A0ABS4MEE3_9LACO|nr:IS607 family transposase [Lactobacillus colini]MBP2058062.1 putative site-specific integrase-resolvase [Lactobacillus colini]
MKIYKPKDAAKKINRSVTTLQRLDREKKLVAHRTTTNRRYYTEDQLNEFLGIKSKTKEINVAYARVSSYSQKAELKHQLEYIRNYANAKGFILNEEITDIGSGLNYKRPKWNKLLKDVEARKVNRIFVTYKDRFIRFGFDWFKQYCSEHNAEIIVLNNPETSPEQEITDDLITILHVFSSRSYGIRKYQSKIKKELKEEQKRGQEHNNSNSSNQNLSK